MHIFSIYFVVLKRSRGNWLVLNVMFVNQDSKFRMALYWSTVTEIYQGDFLDLLRMLTKVLPVVLVLPVLYKRECSVIP